MADRHDGCDGCGEEAANDESGLGDRCGVGVSWKKGSGAVYIGYV